ncbi:hypothetical protein QTP88_014259 [Uroleucon formosanum]
MSGNNGITYIFNMSDKRLRDCDILQLLDEGNKSDLSDFSEGEDEQFDFPSDEFDNLLHEYELFGIDDAVNTEERKSPGHDLITAEIARKLPDKAIIHLTHIFNAILRISHFPIQWKLATIILFPKPNKPIDNPSSYRPISLLPFFSKLFEKLILTRIYPIIKKKKLIPDTQFGFREHHSTIHQIHRLADTIACSLEKKLYTSAVFLDISQAFDKVWHPGLLFKLKTFLPPSYYLFFKSYLSERHFLVRSGTEHSSISPILAGVPQGAVASPTLFNLYSADQPTNPNTQIAEYADDKDIVPNTKDINQIQNAVSSDVVTSISDQTTNTLLESDNFIQDPGEKSTNALILFSSGFGPYQPNNIIFPQHSGRKFRPEWYSSFPWIEYSPSSNSAFCFYCRAFPSNTSDPTFVSVGFKQWSKASYKSFPQHEKSFGHKEASAKLAGYKSSKKSGSIINSLLYCARQGIAVRGHREDEDSSNKGNFLELLTLRANDNDIIQRYFIEKEKTFRYVSGDYTNTFLEYLANIVIKNIIDNVIAAGIFSIIVDETQDLSPAEVFLGFYETETTDGETLSMLIKSTFISHGLKIENIRGQCYDGAASMRGSYKGVQARIREENHLAMYIHCNAHILNLCLIDLAKQVSYVRNVFGTLNTLHNFIGASSKRHAIFEKMYSVLNVSTCDGPKTLKSLSDTRWSCRLDALKAVLLNFQTVVSTLEDISENDAVYGSDANALLNFNNTWNEVDILRKQYNVSSPILPRKQKIPAKLGGGLKEVENTTINKHYKINIYFAVLDNIINDMGERFEENNLYVLNCMQDILLNDMPNNNSFKEINKMYGFDEDNLKAETTILNRMYKTVHDQNNVQSKINFIASENYKAGFPTLTRLIQLFITVPTNSASCERSFSCLRRLKTYLRTTMGQSRLNSLGILQIERERSSLIDKDEVIDKFSAAAECRGRRLLLQ